MTIIKKKIIITMTYMHIGGAERSLISLLHSIDYSRYEVDLFLFSHEGEFMTLIPHQVNLLPELQTYKALVTPLQDLKKTSRFLYCLKKLSIGLAILRYKCSGTKTHEHGITQYCQSIMLPLMPKINIKHYDLAISFISFHNIVSDKLKAKVKWGWFHSDYHQVSPFIRLDKQTWNRLDKIVHVSEAAQQAFLYYHPELSNKTCVIENILSSAYVHMQAKEPIKFEKQCVGEIYLLTVGRLCEAKNYSMAIDACYLLKKQGLNIKWLVLGTGHLESILQQKVTSLALEKQFIFLGSKINPYPYMQLCDIYVQPSIFEGKSVSVREAQILGKPVIATNYATASSQIIHELDGLIVEMTPKAVAEAITYLIKQPSLRNLLSQNCRARDYGNETEIEKIYHSIL